MDTMQTFQQFLNSQVPRVDLVTFTVDLLLTMILTLVLSVVYNRYGGALSNRKEFSRNLVIVGMTTMMIITIVKSSLALSLGLVGALSIVRFRTPIKEPEELAYLFLSIAIGLGLGAGQRAVVTVGFIVIAGVIWVYNFRRSSFEDQSMHLMVSSATPSPDLLNRIVGVLQNHTLAIRLRRVDETADSFESDFSISFDQYENLDELKRSLRSIDENLQISFLDTRLG